MKILLVNQHYKDFLGGSEVQTDIIANNLQELGNEVIYLAINGYQEGYQTNYKVLKSSLTFLRFLRILKGEKPDIIYWRYNRIKLLISVLAARLSGIKFVFAISGPSDYSLLLRRKRRIINAYDAIKHSFGTLYYEIGYLINYLSFFLVDGVVTQLYCQTRMLPVQREVTIPNSVNLSIADFFWPKPYIVWVSNLKSIKNPELFFDLASQFQDSDIDFLMVGKIQEHIYEDYFNNTDKPFNLYYIGYQPIDVTNGIIANSLFLVHTCNPEGFPNVMIQSWSLGKPTLSLYYDPDNLIEKYHLGSLSGDFKKLVADTRRYIEDDVLRNEVGLNAKEFSRNFFNSRTNSKKLEGFLNEIINQPFLIKN